MLSPYCESKDVIQQDCSYSSSGDECLDDIKADLISSTLSNSNSSIVNFDMKNLSFQSTPKTNCDNSPVHTTRDTPSDSFLVIFNPSSEKNSVFSSTEILTQYSGVQLHEACNISSPKVMKDSETLNNKNELILSSMKHMALQHNTDAQNIHGFAQPHINQDKNKSFSKCKLSLSQHDVSRLPDFPLKFKSRDFSSDTIQSQSITTISSGLKSKDSGLPRSLSCLSLSSSGRGYEHVQSKVKEYIRQIKEAAERRKSLKSGDISNKSIPADNFSYVSDENNSTASEKTLAAVIRDLHCELQDREIVLLKLQDNYDKLLIKYAEAENRIDQLRFKVIDPSLKLSTQSQEQNHNFPNAESSVLNSTNKFTSPYNRTLCIRAADESLPFDMNGSFLNRIRASNDRTTSHEKPQSSIAQFNEQDIRHNLALSPLVKHYSSSVRLDKSMEPLSEISSVKTTEESFQQELSLFNSMAKGRSNSERTSVTQSSNMHADEYLGSARSSYQKYVCRCMGNAVTPQGGKCDFGKSCADVCEFCLSQSKQCKKIPVVSEIKIPECIIGKEALLCKKSLEESEAKHLHNTAFEKVSRWQESLPPPLELIEPSCYDSLDCHSSGSKISNQNFIKKFATLDGHDRGCPHSELYNFSVQPNPVKFSARKISLRTELETVSQRTRHKGAFLSVPYKSIISDDERMSDNKGDLRLPDSLKPTECSRSTVIPKPLNIDSCECWNRDVEQFSVSLELCDQKPKNTFQDFHVPPLKLGSLVDGDDGIDSNTDGANNTYSSSVTTLPEAEGVSKSHLHYSSEENLSSSHQDISESTIYSSSTYVASDFQASKALNDVKFANNKMYPHLSNACDIDSQQLKNSGRKSERKQYNNVQPVKDDAVRRRMNHTNIQNDSLQASATTSTSYRSIQPYKMTREMKHASTQQYCGGKSSHLAETNDCGISSSGNIPVHTEGHESSNHHAVGEIESHILRRKLLGLALRRLLLELLNTENCLDNSCICHKSSRKVVAPRYHIHHSSRGNENIAAENDSRNISHTGTHVNFASVLSDIECGAKRTISTDKVVSNVVEDASPKDSISCSKTSDVNSTIIPKDQSLEKVKYNLMKGLHEIDQCAEQLKLRSEAILNILAVQIKPNS